MSRRTAGNRSGAALFALKDPDHYAVKNHVVFIPQMIPKVGQLKDNFISPCIVGITGEWNVLLVDYAERFGLTQFAHSIESNQFRHRTRFEIARILPQASKSFDSDEPLAISTSMHSKHY